MQDIKLGGNGGFLEDGVGVAQVEEVLGKVGVKLKENETTFRDMGEVINDLAGKWSTLNSVEQSAVAKSLAGTRQRENFLVLMNNFNKVLELQGVAADSSGLAMDRFGIFLEGTEAKTNKLKASLEGLWMKSLNSDSIQSFITGTTSVVEFIDEIGGLAPVLEHLIGILLLLKAKDIAIGIIGLGSSIKNTMTSMYELGKASTMTFTAIKAGGLSAQTVISGLSGVVGIAMLAFSVYAMSMAKARQEEEATIQRNQEMASSYKETVASLSDLKNKYIEISQSTGDSQGKKKQLLDVQNQLITAYGEEARSLNLVTGEYSSQLTEIDKLIKAKSKTAQLFLEDRNLQLDQQKTSVVGTFKLSSEQEASLKNIKSQIQDAYGKNALTDMEWNEGSGKHEISFGGKDRKEELKIIEDTLALMKNSNLYQTDAYEKTKKSYQEFSSQADEYYSNQAKLNEIKATDVIQTKKQELGIRDLSKATDEQKELLESNVKTYLKGSKNAEVLASATGMLQEQLAGVSKESEQVADSTQTTEDAMTGLQKIFDDTASRIEDLSKMQKELEDGNRLSAKSMTDIVKNYPDLIQYLGDEASLKDALIDKIDEERQAQQEAYNQILMATDNYYQQKMLADTQWVNSVNSNISALYSGLGVAYSGDVSQYKNAELAKAGITEQLINKLGEAWAKYFDSTSGALKTQSEFSAGGNGWSGADYAKMSEAKSAIDGITKQFDSFKFEPISIDVGGVKPSKGGGEKKGAKPKYADYISEGLDESINAIKSKSDTLANEISLINDKISLAESKGDKDIQFKLLDQLSAKYEAKKKLLEQQNKDIYDLTKKEVKAINSKKIKGFSNTDLNKLDDKKLDEITRQYEAQIEKAEVAGNDKLKADLEMKMKYIEEHGNAIIKIRGLKVELNEQSIKDAQEKLQNEISKIDFTYDRKYSALEDSNADIETQQILLNEEGEAYKKLQGDKYQNAIKARELADQAIQALRKKGLTDENEQIQKYIDLHRDAENTRLNLLKERAEKQREIEKKSLEDGQEAVNDLLEITLDMLKKEYEQKKKNIELEKDGYKAIIDARKEALQLQKDEHDYQKGLDEKQKSVKDIQDKLTAMQFDTKNVAQRKQLQADLVKAQDELNEYQYDNRIDKETEALDKEYESFEKQKDAEIKVIDDMLDQEGLMREKALKLIEGKTQDFYNRLLEYNRVFGNGCDQTLQSIWSNAQSAIEQYGGSAMSVLDNIANKLKEIENSQSSISADIDYGDEGKVVGIPKNTSGDSGNSPTSKAKMTEKEARIAIQKEEQEYLHNQAMKASGNKASLDYINKLRADYGMDKTGKITTSGKIPSDAWSKNKAKYGFSEGGEQNFTGLALLHGSTSRPERILSPDQTKDFNKLVGIMPSLNNLMGNMIGKTPTIDTVNRQPNINLKFDTMLNVEGNLDKSIDTTKLINQAVDKTIQTLKNSFSQNGMFQNPRFI